MLKHRARAVALSVALLAAGACGIGTDDEPRAISPESTTHSSTGPSSPSTRAAAGDKSTAVAIFFVRKTDEGVQLVALERQVPRVTPQNVIEALIMQPPTGNERAEGYTTALPPGTSLVSSNLRSDGVLVVDVTNGIFEIQGESVRNAFAQIVCTATMLEEVRGVLFEVNGEPRAVPDGESRQTNRPLHCRNYASLTGDDPAADVQALVGGAAVTAADPGPSGP